MPCFVMKTFKEKLPLKAWELQMPCTLGKALGVDRFWNYWHKDLKAMWAAETVCWNLTSSPLEVFCVSATISQGCDLSTGMVLVAVMRARQQVTRMHPCLAVALSLSKTMKSCLIMNWMNMIWTITMLRNTQVRKICVSDVQCKWRTFPLLVVLKALIS